MAEDTYRTVVGTAREELKIKGSRFIGEAFCVTSSDEAERQIQQVRKREYNATHHCPAYRIGPTGATVRYSDDGEPNGTAGLPIIRHIEGRDLTNTLVVVTRYYGGTKLGTGGLIRAYGDTARLVLDAIPIETHILRSRLHIRFAYADTSPAMHVISQYDARIERTDYGNDTAIMLAVRRSEAAAFQAAFVQALHGRGYVQPI